MRLNLQTWFALGAVGALVASFSAAQSPGGSKGEAVLAHAAASNKSCCLVFYKAWEDPTVATMAQAVKAHVEKYPAHVVWNAVQVTDPAEKSVVDRFSLSRAPMPMVVAVHPNGAVTGYFPSKVTDADLAKTLVSPTKAECMKQLQQNQLVLLCVQTSPQQPLPQGVLQFQADPQFAKRTRIVTALANDTNETGFFADMKVAQGQPSTVFLAPPGVVVGRFAPTATAKDLATALHAAGKCCDDKNCKHHHH